MPPLLPQLFPLTHMPSLTTPPTFAFFTGSSMPLTAAPTFAATTMRLPTVSTATVVLERGGKLLRPSLRCTSSNLSLPVTASTASSSQTTMSG